MERVKIDLKTTGKKIKEINSVNNGPTNKGVRLSSTDSNFYNYKALEIPYARTHDASFYQGYGGEFAVDVHRIFRDFDSDLNDCKSYIFEPTDKYLLNMKEAGTEPFYRLGASIEHHYKFGTFPPKDYLKWAKICEHIINHYNNGWNKGYRMGIKYWEIWNEPDCRNADGSNPCWQGTEEEFIDFYITVSKYLKEKFPHLYIGGPAFCTMSSEKFIREFLKSLKENEAPLDFFSYHCYDKSPKGFIKDIHKANKYLSDYGFSDTKTILNEWNYIKGWSGDLWDYSIKSESSLKGASFVLAIATTCQNENLDMLMYYDARPCSMNGIFDRVTLEPKKTYYAYEVLRDIKNSENEITIENNIEDIYILASEKEKHSEIMITYYNDCDDLPSKEICLNIKNPHGKIKVSYYLTDYENNNKLVRSEIFTAEDLEIYLDMKLFAIYNIKIDTI